MLVFLLLGPWLSLSFAQTSEESPVFTEAQADLGSRAYQQSCAACHGAKLEGVGMTPPLAGTRFDHAWRGKSADVLSFHIRRMPPASEPGSLSEETYTNILAYVLASNEFEPGDVELPADLDLLRNIAIPELEGATYDPVVPVVKSAAQTALLDNLRGVLDDLRGA